MQIIVADDSLCTCLAQVVQSFQSVISHLRNVLKSSSSLIGTVLSTLSRDKFDHVANVLNVLPSLSDSVAEITTQVFDTSEG